MSKVNESISIPECNKPMTGRISCVKPNQANTPEALRLSNNIRFAAAECPDIINENTITRGSLGG